MTDKTYKEIMQQALKALEFFADTAICSADTKMAEEGIAALRAALAEQESVAGVVIREGLPTLLQDKHIKSTDQRLYTAPQKREWQGLTDEEYNRLVMEHLGPRALTGGKMSVYDAFLLAIRVTEAKLKEKNT